MFSLQIVETRSIHHSQQQQYFISHRSYLLYSHRFRLFSGHHPLARAGRKKKSQHRFSLFLCTTAALCHLWYFFFFWMPLAQKPDRRLTIISQECTPEKQQWTEKESFFFKESHAHWRHSLVGYKTRTEQWYLCASSMYFLPQNDVPCSL